MLRIVQNRSAVSAKSYYSHASYYGESQELAGRWGGQAARMLGLEGRIEQCDFNALCENLDPRSGKPLTARTNHDRTVGYDFNWHVPKGLSLAYAFGDTRIGQVFEEVVSQTMQEMEAEAKTRVRIGGKQEDRQTGNLVWGQFLHTTARPIGGEPDPHLHAHCFVFNATFDEVEHRFKAGQFRDLKRDASYFEARMHARLAKRIKDELGYNIQRRGRSWDIAGLPDSLTKKFSRRTTQIEEKAKQDGITSADEKAELGTKTRQSKSAQFTMEELRGMWRSRMSEPERARMDAVLEQSSTDGGTLVNPGPADIKEAVEQSLSHCFERDAVVPERQVLTEALRVGTGQIEVDELEAEAHRQRLITREIDGRRMATTPEVLSEEQAVLEFARRGRNSLQPLNDQWDFQTDWLSDEQKSAIGRLINSHDRVQLILGGAGTGKTTLMTEAVAAIEAGGHRVLTFAPSAEASRGVLRSEGFDGATTVAELLVNNELQETTRGQVIWIDEAGLLGSRQLKQVFDLADRMEARVILSGDWKRQHGSVERGGVLGLIDRYTGISPIQIETIRRQQGSYRDAIATLASGQIGTGFDQLDRLGWVHELDEEERNPQIAADLLEVVRSGKSSLVVSPTHREADRLTETIRDTFRRNDLITGPEHEVLTLKPLHLTEAERSDPALMENGDVIIFHQNAKGFRKGDRIRIDGALPRAITDQAPRFSVFRPSAMRLATGDKIRITAGGKTKDGLHRLNNGAVFDVARIRESGDIELGNGWVVDAKFGHLTHGFVTTSHASQGRTVDHVFIAESAESFAAGSMEQFYVSASRGRKSARIYTDSKSELKEIIQRSSANVSASEMIWRPDEAQQRHRKQHDIVTRSRIEHEQQKTREFAHER